MAAKKKTIIISAAVAVILSLCIGITMAYLGSFRQKTNELKVGKDTVSIKEDFSSPEVLKSTDNETHKTVTVKNTGTVDCFVRVYAEFSDNYVGDRAMVKNSNGTKNDYMFWEEFKTYLSKGTNNISPDWVFIPDNSTEDGKLKGYFYYKKVVKPNEETSALFTDFKVSFTPNNGVYFNKPSYWGDNIYAYIYNGDEQPLGAWPGTSMSLDASSGLYFLPFASTNSDYKIIFSDNNSNQVPAYNETGFTYQNLGIYTYNDVLSPPSAGTERIYFKKPSSGWDKVYAYIYDTESDDKPLGVWDWADYTNDKFGTEMNLVADDIYSVDIPTPGKSSWRVMFNNGKRDQEKLQLPPENESGYEYRNLGFYTENGLFKMEDPNLDKITDYDIIVYSETVQTTEITSDSSSKVYTDEEWKQAWKSFLKVTPANP